MKTIKHLICEGIIGTYSEYKAPTGHVEWTRLIYAILGLQT